MRNKSLKSIIVMALVTTSFYSVGQAADVGNALGDGSIANGEYSISTGKKSTAIGSGAVATGDNLTRADIEAKLAKNREIQSQLDTARANWQTASEAYNRAKTEFDNTNEVWGRVDAANKKIDGYNNEITNTLQPKVNQTTTAYNTAKSEYDTLYKDYEDRIASIKTMDFTLYKDGSAAGYNLDKMAIDLKAKTEAGTTFNYSTDFYKSYIQNYIKATGDLRENEIIYSKSQSESFTNTNSNNQSNIINKYDLSDNSWCDLSWGYSYNNTGGMNYNGNKLIDKNMFNNSTVSNKPTYSLKFYDVDTETCTETEYKKYTSQSQIYKNGIQKFWTDCNDRFLTNEIKNIYIKTMSLKVDCYVKSSEIAYYQGQYEANKNTNNEKALEWLSKKEKALAEFNQMEAEFNKLNTDAGRYVTYYKRNEIKKWYKENVTDVKDSVKTALSQVSDGLDASIQAKKKAMEDALAAKNAADSALAAKKKQIADATPTDAEKAEAAKLQTKADELAKTKEKLDADKAALDAAKSQLDQLTDLKNIGENAIAIGTDALTTGKNAIGVGTSVIVTGENAIGIGNGTIVAGTSSIAIGSGTAVSGASSISIGVGSTVTGSNSLAFGNHSTVTGNNTIVLGNNLTVSENNALVIGGKRIMDLLDGVEDTDAVSYGQVKKMVASASGTKYKAGGDISISSENAISVNKNGQVVSGNTGIVTGNTVYKVTNALESRLATQQNKVASNTTTLNDLSTTVSGLSGSIADINSNVMSATKNLASSLSNRMQSDMGNLTADGKAVIRDLIKETLKSYNSNASTSTIRDNITSPVATYEAPVVHSDTPADTVTSKDLDTIKTDFDTKLDTKVNKTDFNALKDTVGANTDKIAKNTESINTNTAAIADLKTGKADVDGSNIDVTKFTEKLGVGEIAKDNGGLVTGGTVFTALEQKADYGYVNAGFNMMQAQMQSMQQRLTQDINRVGAGAAALAGLHPQDYDPNNKLDFAAGYGHYKNANATALGIFYRPNAGTTVSLSGTIGNGDPMISAGLSFKLGMGKNVEKVVITKEKYDEQQAENQEMKERIHELEVALQSMMNK